MALTKATLIDLNSNELVLDLDADTSITADTDDTIHFKIAGSDEITMTAGAIAPSTSDGNALGTTSLMFSDLFLASGSVVNFNNGDVTLTHSSNTLVLAGGSLDINGQELILDADGDTKIAESSDDVIDLSFAGVTGSPTRLGAGYISLKNQGSQSYIDFYCESSNAHYARLQAPAHSDFSGNVTITLPNDTTTLATTNLTETLANKTLSTPIIAEIDSGGGSSITLDAATDIILDADGGDIFFKDGGTTFGSATNTSGNLIIKSGTTTALTFSGANVTVAGEVQMTTLDIGGTNVTATAAELNKLDALSRGSIIYGNDSAATTVLTKGTVGQVLTSDGTDISWDDVSGGTSWQSSIVTASTLTAVAGEGYPINTTSNACTVTLPSSASVGDQVQIVDYAGTFATNNITLTSSLNIEGGGGDKILTTNREGVIITYVDVTQGWVATTGVNSGNQAIDPIQYSADFLVIAGGGSGAICNGSNPGGGGGGAGGYRNSFNSESSGGGASAESSLTFNAGTTYTITVGAGGATKVHTGSLADGNSGVNSSIAGSGITTITSNGGGGGGAPGVSGGSGGGATASGNQTGGSGTTNQGFDGGDVPNSASNRNAGAGGGGAGAVGSNVNSGGTTGVGGNGGAGVANTITGSSVTRGGGGGGAGNVGAIGTGGSGGGGNGANNSTNSVAGTANTGGGGGGGNATGTYNGQAGGSGVVILSMLDADYSGTTTGSPTVATGVSGKTVLTFNGDGSYTA